MEAKSTGSGKSLTVLVIYRFHKANMAYECEKIKQSFARIRP